MKNKRKKTLILTTIVGTVGAVVGYAAYKFVKTAQSEKYDLDRKLGETPDEVKLKLEELGFEIAGYCDKTNIVFAYDRHNELIGYNVNFYIAKTYQLPFEKGNYERISDRYPKTNLLMIFENSSTDNPALKTGIAVYDNDFGDFLHYFEYDSEEDIFV